MADGLFLSAGRRSECLLRIKKKKKKLSLAYYYIVDSASINIILLCVIKMLYLDTNRGPLCATHFL